MFRMASTGGRVSCGSRRRAYVLNVSTSWRCASVQIVSKTSGRLAAAAHASERDEPVLRHVDVDALEVVRACASDLDGGHRASSSLTGVLVQPRQSPFGTFQRGADDAHASPEAAETGRPLWDPAGVLPDEQIHGPERSRRCPAGRRTAPSVPPRPNPCHPRPPAPPVARIRHVTAPDSVAKATTVPVAAVTLCPILFSSLATGCYLELPPLDRYAVIPVARTWGSRS